VIELGLLGLLNEQSLHGYELKKQLSELAGSWSLSFGSLYPALNRLERTGMVKAVEAHDGDRRDGPLSAHALDDPVIPMTGALSGELAAFRQRLAPRKAAGGPGRRGKKVYGITDRGRDRLTELLVAPGPDDERSFAWRVAFCRHLPPTERLALFERRKAELTGQAGRARRLSAGRRLDPYRRSLRARADLALAHDLAWLDELIDATRADSSPVPHRRDEAPPSPSLATLTTIPPVRPGAPKEGF
jgi:DNA-binding PadR family transcriptional regulator